MAKKCDHYKNINGGMYAMLSPSVDDDNKCICRLCGSVIDASISDTLSDRVTNIRNVTDLYKNGIDELDASFYDVVISTWRREYISVKIAVEYDMLKVVCTTWCDTYKEYMKPIINDVYKTRKINGLD